MQVSKRLVITKQIPIDNSKDLVNSLDVALAEYYCKDGNYEHGLEIYRKVLSEINSEPERSQVVSKYLSSALEYSHKLMTDKKPV